jgi:hypothetical protein
VIQLQPTSAEPPHGSVLMIESKSGTAVQRFYSDGAYHATTGKVYPTFADLFDRNNVNPRRVFLVALPEED